MNSQTIFKFYKNFQKKEMLVAVATILDYKSF